MNKIDKMDATNATSDSNTKLELKDYFEITLRILFTSPIVPILLMIAGVVWAFPYLVNIPFWNIIVAVISVPILYVLVKLLYQGTAIIVIAPFALLFILGKGLNDIVEDVITGLFGD